MTRPDPPAPPRKPLVVVNPVSGVKSPDEKRGILDDAFARHGIRARFLETSPDPDHDEWARAARESDAVLVGGGDGTVREMVEVLSRAGVERPVGHVPFGTSSALALAMGLSRDPAEALEQMLSAPRPVAFDLGHVVELDRRFLLMAAAGFPADIVRDAPRALKSRVGELAYLWAGVRNLGELLEPSRVTIRGDDASECIESAAVFLINIGALRHFGAEIAPSVDARDGELTVGAVSASGLPDVLGMAVDVLLGREREADGLRLFEAATAEIEFEEPVVWHLDGELTEPHAKLTFRALPSAQELFVGPSFGGGGGGGSGDDDRG